jgi:TatD DNase family protein
MADLPSLDAHAHIDPSRTSVELAEAGAVLAMTLSLDEADKVIGRKEALVAWGVGCHPRKLAAQNAFDPDRFADLASHTPIIGEVGLDVAYQLPLERQLSTLRTVLSFAAKNGRIVSLHSFGTSNGSSARSTTLILDELRRTPIAAPVLHWWTGNAAETRRAVELGCYFSVHSAVARRSLFRTQVPLERLLVESDHGWGDPPGAIPHRVIWVEYLLSASLGMDVCEIRQLVWQNFSDIVRLTGTRELLPEQLVRILGETRFSGENTPISGGR